MVNRSITIIVTNRSKLDKRSAYIIYIYIHENVIGIAGMYYCNSKGIILLIMYSDSACNHYSEEIISLVHLRGGCSTE